MVYHRPEMRREEHGSGPGILQRAAWWSLAVVHVVPLVRIAPAVGDDPARHAASLALLLAVVAFCVAAATLDRRRGVRGRGSTVVFLLAAAVAHHDAVGSPPPAELPAPVVPVLLGGGAAAAASPWLRRLRRALRRLGDRLAAAFGRPLPPVAATRARLARPSARPIRRVGGPPPVRGPPAIGLAIA